MAVRCRRSSCNGVAGDMPTVWGCRTNRRTAPDRAEARRSTRHSSRLPNAMVAKRLHGDFCMHPIFLPRGEPAIPITFVTSRTWAEQRARLDLRERAFADAIGFEPVAGKHVLLPGPAGGLGGVLF